MGGVQTGKEDRPFGVRQYLRLSHSPWKAEIILLQMTKRRLGEVAQRRGLQNCVKTPFSCLPAPCYFQITLLLSVRRLH